MQEVGASVLGRVVVQGASLHGGVLQVDLNFSEKLLFHESLNRISFGLGRL